MGSPPATGARFVRSALYSACAVKPECAGRAPGRDFPVGRPVRCRGGGAASGAAPGDREPA
jgi:hypothetical protein